MSFKERTSEFFSAVETIRSRGSNFGGPIERARLLNHGGSSSSYHNPQLQSRTEFTKAASTIGKEITSTMAKLQKLTALAKKKSLFDDRPVEINELIYMIKQDIAKINRQIGQLSDYLSKAESGGLENPSEAKIFQGNRYSKEHSRQVITSLQTKLATTSDEFKTILEVRFQNLKEQKQRRDQYSFGMEGGEAGSSSGGSSMLAGGNMSDSPLYHPERRSQATPVNGIPGASSSSSSGENHVIDFGGFGGSSQQQLLQAPNSSNMEYLESRSQAIESIESTIAELGQIYQNFATILAGQKEMVQRIDDNVRDVEMNVEGAHGQLVKYYQNISSNRSLMLKVFAVVLVFFLLFVLMT